MDQKDLISKIIADFSAIPIEIPGIYLFGSYAEGKADGRSDVDICLVAGTKIDPKQLQFLAWRYVNSNIYDIRVFEFLPLYMQIRIIAKGILLQSCDIPALTEYLYSYWKRWDDQRWYQTPIPGAPGFL